MKTKKSDPVLVENSTRGKVVTPEIQESEKREKGKQTVKFNLVCEAEKEEKEEKLNKVQIFAAVKRYLCPVSFDSSTLENSLQPLVNAGIMSEETKEKTLQIAEKQFFQEHAQELEQYNKLTFDEIVTKLQKNQDLYKKVLSCCGVAELKKERYFVGENVVLYRAKQDENNTFSYCPVSDFSGSQKFTVDLFAEYREITADNILFAIRYYSAKQDATKRLYNLVQDNTKKLTAIYSSACKALESGFNIRDILNQVAQSCDAEKSRKIQEFAKELENENDENFAENMGF